MTDATSHRVQFVQLPAWFVKLPDGTLRLATEEEAEEARRLHNAPPPLPRSKYQVGPMEKR